MGILDDMPKEGFLSPLEWSEARVVEVQDRSTLTTKYGLRCAVKIAFGNGEEGNLVLFRSQLEEILQLLKADDLIKGQTFKLSAIDAGNAKKIWAFEAVSR